MVEGLPRDGFSKGDSEIFSTLPEHLIGEQKQLNAKLYPQEFPEIGKSVEEGGVVSAHEDRNNIPFVLYRLLDEVLVPFQIRNDAPFFPGSKACREDEDLLFRLVG